MVRSLPLLVLLGVMVTATAVAVQARDNHVAQSGSFAAVIADVQPRLVKLYGAGGVRGLEAYQSGFLISSQGHILTVWSYVLDTDFVLAVLHDGRRYEAKLVGADPRVEIAVLKIDAQDLPYFDLQQAVDVEVGARVLAFSNLFGVATGDELPSVLHGLVAAKSQLNARRGAYPTPYQGPVVIVDAVVNNPGAAGGVLTDRQGRLVGILGKELRDNLTNTWLNYAIPISAIGPSVEDILAGRTASVERDSSAPAKPAAPWTLDVMGIVLVPEVLFKTPPFIESVRPGSPAAQAGLLPDDLILFVNDRIVPSSAALRSELSFLDRIDPVRLTVQREQELVEVTLRAP